MAGDRDPTSVNVGPAPEPRDTGFGVLEVSQVIGPGRVAPGRAETASVATQRRDAVVRQVVGDTPERARCRGLVGLVAAGKQEVPVARVGVRSTEEEDSGNRS